MTIVLDGSSLTRAQVVEIASRGSGVSLAPAALVRVQRAAISSPKRSVAVNRCTA